MNKAGMIWVGRRIDTPNGWQMPQGGIDDGENARAAALRELHEEIGTDKALIIAESDSWHRYDLPPHLLGKAWGGKYRGQEQRWFLLRFTGDDSDIDIVSDHQEFDAWQWVAPGALCDLIVPFKRAVYEQVVAEFWPQLDTIAD